MAPRGLKKLLKDTTPCKLTRGTYCRFVAIAKNGGKGPTLRGLTKRLDACIFSDGSMPAIARASDAPAGGHWRGPGGGRRRGSAVDTQVSRLAGYTPERRFGSKMLALTRNVFATLAARGLEPVAGQRAVCSERHRVGTAADIVCYNPTTHQLVICELKCGHNGARTAAAIKDGAAQKMRGPLHKAFDSTMNRHLAQLAVTHHLFTKEKRTQTLLGSLGVLSVGGLLLYANDSGVDCYPLVEWWQAKAPRILDACA